MLKNFGSSIKIEDSFKENIKNSYIWSLKDDHLNFKIQSGGPNVL